MRQLDGAIQLVQADRSPVRALTLLALLSLGACAAPSPREGQPPLVPPDRPMEPIPPRPTPYGFREDTGYARSAEEVSGPAVVNLLAQAREDLGAGRAEQAFASLDTALRIEKRNPFVWQELARVHLARAQHEDAEIVAQRSNSFARGNPYIEIENWRVIEQARSGRGDRDGASEARDKVAELQDRIDNE